MINFLHYRIFLILFLSAVSRVASIYFYGDTTVDNEWGVMLDNLEQNKILSVRSVDGVPVPNIFMPPLYPLFLYSIKFFLNDVANFLNVTKIIQLLISLFSIFVFYRILQKLFPKKLTLFGTLVYAFFPLNIYAVSQISSVTLQMFLINIFLLCFINFFKKIDLKNIFGFAISSALLILLRGEFFIFVILSLIYLLLRDKRQIIEVIIITVFIALIISPYLYRNYQIFGVVTITKSSGYNLLKGNHPSTVVQGTGMFKRVGDVVPDVKSKIDSLRLKGPIQEHDLEMDKILFDQAIKYIKGDPLRYIKLYFQKFLSFLFIDINSTYPNYYSLIHIIPKIILSISTIIGVALILSTKINFFHYLSLFYISNIGLFSIFFILPRYSLFLLTIQIIISLYGFTAIKKKIKIKCFNEKNY